MPPDHGCAQQAYAEFCWGKLNLIGISSWQALCQTRETSAGKTVFLRVMEKVYPNNLDVAGNAAKVKLASQAGANSQSVVFGADTGLFELATPSTFWFLMEMGTAINLQPREISEND